MKRKLIKQGNATLTLSLPTEYVKQLNLKAGDEINLEKTGNTIEIALSKTPVVKKKEINVEYLSKKIIERIIAATYRQGIDELSLSFIDPSIGECVQKLINDQLIGYEIIFLSSKTVTIKEISNSSIEEFDTILRRAFLILKNIANESVDALEKNDEILMKSLSASDANINKLTNLCERMMMKYGHKDVEKTPVYYHLVKEIENIGDEFKFIFDFVLENKLKLKKETLEIIKKMKEIISGYYDLFYNFSLKTAEDLFNKVKTEMIKINLKCDPEINVHLLSMLRLIENTIGDFISIKV